MRNILSILCTLILPTFVEAATCGWLITGTVSCTNKTKTAMTQTDSIITPKTKFTRPDDATLKKTLTPEQYAVTQLPNDLSPMSMITNSEKVFM